MNDLVFEFDRIVAGDCITDEEVVSAIRSVLKDSERRPTREDYNELSSAIAQTLFAWRHPEAMAGAMAPNMLLVRQYFESDSMARHVLDSLVSTAIHGRNRLGWSINQRAREDAEIRFQTERVLREFCARPSEEMLELQRQSAEINRMAHDYFKSSTAEDPLTRMRRIVDDNEDSK